MDSSQFDSVEEARTAEGVEAYFQAVGLVADDVLLAQGVEMTALPVRREAFFHGIPVYGDAERAFAVALSAVAPQ